MKNYTDQKLKLQQHLSAPGWLVAFSRAIWIIFIKQRKLITCFKYRHAISASEINDGPGIWEKTTLTMELKCLKLAQCKGIVRLLTESFGWVTTAAFHESNCWVGVFIFISCCTAVSIYFHLTIQYHLTAKPYSLFRRSHHVPFTGCTYLLT